MKKLVSIGALSLCTMLSALTPAVASNFNINNQTSTSAQTLSAGQTGTDHQHRHAQCQRQLSGRDVHGKRDVHQ